MNSHRPRSQNKAKEQALIPEKESRRTWPRCHVSSEKSSKNHKPLEKWAKPNLLPDVTPQPANFSGKYFRQICHVVEPDPPELSAVFSCHSKWPKQGRGRGESRFDLALNGLIETSPIQNEDSQWCAAPFLFRQGWSKSHGWSKANFGVFI